MPVLDTVHNDTALHAMAYQKMAPNRQFYDVVAVKARFNITAQGIDPTPLYSPLCLADTLHDPANALSSSLKSAGDLILGKLGADLTLSGTARSIQAYKRWPVAVKLLAAHPSGNSDNKSNSNSTPLIDYELVATGPRQWQHGLFKGWHLGEPALCDSVPIRYELSYGGRKADTQHAPEDWDSFAANPSGSGYSFAGHSFTDTPLAPQWESSRLLIGSACTAFTGLGPVARYWHSRAQYAGTYDASWQQHFHTAAAQGTIPDYPSDFDVRFYQCAHPKLQTAHSLRGDEHLRLHGLFAHTPQWQGQLPKLAIQAQLTGYGAQHTGLLALDTVHIDLERSQLELVWHMSLPHTQGYHSAVLSARTLS
jgi:hypothetical protein